MAQGDLDPHFSTVADEMAFPQAEVAQALQMHLQSLRHFRLRKCHLIGDGREMGIEVALRHLNILRDINQHRTWTA